MVILGGLEDIYKVGQGPGPLLGIKEMPCEGSLPALFTQMGRKSALGAPLMYTKWGLRGASGPLSDALGCLFFPESQEGFSGQYTRPGLLAIACSLDKPGAWNEGQTSWGRGPPAVTVSVCFPHTPGGPPELVHLCSCVSLCTFLCCSEAWKTTEKGRN